MTPKAALDYQTGRVQNYALGIALGLAGVTALSAPGGIDPVGVGVLLLAAVVYGNSQADHIGRYHRSTRPCLDRSAIVALDSSFNFFHQVKVNKRTFLQ